MRRVGAQLLLALLSAAWIAPAALATYLSPQHACCRRGGHHCPQSTDRAFRDAKLHCGSCQSLLISQQAPRISPAAIGITSSGAHPFAHEFASEFSPAQEVGSRSQRAPPRER